MSSVKIINNRPLILCPWYCPAPKKCLTSSNWISRNDSSNVQAILHPENYSISPGLKYNEKTKGEVVVKQILSRNNCYCRCKNKKLPRPSFFKRPNSCVNFDDLSDDVNSSEDFQRKSLKKCDCLDERGNNDDGLLRCKVEELRETKSLPTKVDLKYTSQRKKYDEYRHTEAQKINTRIEECEEREKLDKADEELSAGDSEKVHTILGTQGYRTTSSFTNYRDSEVNDIEDGEKSNSYIPKYSDLSVPEFRQEHYFETHNIGDSGDFQAKPHTCVHQFQLNDRWLPEAVNKDSFDRSLCKICQKPMDESRLSLSSGQLFSRNRISRSKLRNFAEASRFGFAPTYIDLGRNKSNIELLMKDSDAAKLSSYIVKAKAPIHCNSLALRHQKMRSC